jgi:hypothetical protein
MTTPTTPSTLSSANFLAIADLLPWICERQGYDRAIYVDTNPYERNLTDEKEIEAYESRRQALKSILAPYHTDADPIQLLCTDQSFIFFSGEDGRAESDRLMKLLNGFDDICYAMEVDKVGVIDENS